MSNVDPMTLVPIGVVVREPADAPAPGVDAGSSQAERCHASIEALRVQPVRIIIDPYYADGLLGIEAGSDILVLCYFDRAARDVLQVHPRGDRTSPLRGVFATRSPSRPNPIGVTTAHVLRIDGLTLEVMGLDALDGTPVVDIKHHSAYFDQPYDGNDA